LFRAAAGATIINLADYRLFAADKQYPPARLKLVRSSVVIDMLGPFALAGSQSKPVAASLRAHGHGPAKTIRDSGIKRSISRSAWAVRTLIHTLQFVAGWNGFIAHHDEHLLRVDSASGS